MVCVLLQIWVSLFGAECPTVEFTQQWQGIVKNIVESRVNKVRLCVTLVYMRSHIYTILFLLQLNPENRINLLCMLESCEGTPDLLVNIFTEAAIASLDLINDQV